MTPWIPRDAIATPTHSITYALHRLHNSNMSRYFIRGIEKDLRLEGDVSCITVAYSALLCNPSESTAVGSNCHAVVTFVTCVAGCRARVLSALSTSIAGDATSPPLFEDASRNILHENWTELSM